MANLYTVYCLQWVQTCLSSLFSFTFFYPARTVLTTARGTLSNICLFFQSKDMGVYQRSKMQKAREGGQPHHHTLASDSFVIIIAVYFPVSTSNRR